MRKAFYLNLCILIGINLLIKPVYVLIIETKVQNVVGHSDYGSYFLFLNLAYILQLINDLGMSSMVMSTLPNERQNFAQKFAQGIYAKAVLAIIYLATIFTVGYFRGYIQLNTDLFLLVSINIILVSSLQYFRSFIAGMGEYLKDSLISALDKALLLAILIYLLYLNPSRSFSITHFALSQMASLVITLAICLLVLKSKIRFPKLDVIYLKEMVKESLPYGLIIFLMFAYTRLDSLMIEAMLDNGTYQLGLYASAYRYYDAANMFGVLFTGLLLPMFARLKDKKQERDQLFFAGLKSIWWIAICIALPVVFHSREIMMHFQEVTTPASIACLSWLMFTFVAKATIFISVTMLTAEQAFKQLYILLIGTVLLNIVLNYILIPIAGIVGAAQATLYVHLSMALGALVLCHSQKLVHFDWKPYVSLLSFALIASIIAYYFFQINPIDNWFISMMLCAVLLTVLFFMINFKSLWKAKDMMTKKP